MTVPSGSCRSSQPQNVLSRWWHRLAEEHFKGSCEQHKRCRYVPLDLLLDLHFGDVLGDALCDER